MIPEPAERGKCKPYAEWKKLLLERKGADLVSRWKRKNGKRKGRCSEHQKMAATKESEFGRGDTVLLTGQYLNFFFSFYF